MKKLFISAVSCTSILFSIKSASILATFGSVETIPASQLCPSEEIVVKIVENLRAALEDFTSIYEELNREE